MRWLALVVLGAVPTHDECRSEIDGLRLQVETLTKKTKDLSTRLERLEAESDAASMRRLVK